MSDPGLSREEHEKMLEYRREQQRRDIARIEAQRQQQRVNDCLKNWAEKEEKNRGS